MCTNSGSGLDENLSLPKNKEFATADEVFDLERPGMLGFRLGPSLFDKPRQSLASLGQIKSFLIGSLLKGREPSPTTQLFQVSLAGADSNWFVTEN